MAFPELSDLPKGGVLEKIALLNDAFRTEDEIGIVLRLHLLLEQFLTAFLRLKVTADLTKFVPIPRNFGDKLSLSVAFGLNLDLSNSIYHFNKIRNRLAHGSHTKLEKDWVHDYLQAAEVVAKAHGFKESLQHGSLNLAGNPPVRFG